MALGAAVQAGIYEGQVSELMVMDVWQASLMRAFAAQLAGGGADAGDSDSDGEGWADEGGDGSGWEDLPPEGEAGAAAAAQGG